MTTFMEPSKQATRVHPQEAQTMTTRTATRPATQAVPPPVRRAIRMLEELDVPVDATPYEAMTACRDAGRAVKMSALADALVARLSQPVTRMSTDSPQLTMIAQALTEIAERIVLIEGYAHGVDAPDALDAVDSMTGAMHRAGHALGLRPDFDYTNPGD